MTGKGTYLALAVFVLKISSYKLVVLDEFHGDVVFSSLISRVYHVDGVSAGSEVIHIQY